MISEAVKMIIIQFIIVAIFLIIIYILFKNLKSYEYEKKFSEFSLLSNKDVDISFFDRIHFYLWQLIHKISDILKYSKVIEKHSNKFEKDIKLDNINIKSSLDYISLKIVTGFLFVITFILTIIFKFIKFDIMKILIVFMIGYLLPNILISYKKRIKKQKIEEDLLKAIIIMNNSFKSGRNIMQAIETVKDELSGPIAEEFEKISLDISYGLGIDTVFSRFYSRLKTEDVKYIASSLTILNKTGGNIIKVFSMIEQSFFEKRKLKNELESLTASSVFVFRALIALPLIFVLVISILNPEYFKPLISSSIGILILLLIISLYIIYIIIIRKALKVEM